MVGQLEVELGEGESSLGHVEKAKALICALNVVSGNLPLPPDLFNFVSSIYSSTPNGAIASLPENEATWNTYKQKWETLRPSWSPLGDGSPRTNLKPSVACSGPYFGCISWCCCS